MGGSLKSAHPRVTHCLLHSLSEEYLPSGSTETATGGSVPFPKPAEAEASLKAAGWTLTKRHVTLTLLVSMGQFVPFNDMFSAPSLT